MTDEQVTTFDTANPDAGIEELGDLRGPMAGAAILALSRAIEELAQRLKERDEQITDLTNLIGDMAASREETKQ